MMGERGLVLPSWLVALSAMVVALALVGFAVSGDREPETVAQSQADRSATATPAPGGANTSESQSPRGDGSKGAAGNKQDGRKSKGRLAPPDRRSAYVEVYNASAITGLAAQTMTGLRDSGWRVVAADNWYGEIPASTVYYPADLANQGRLLAADLGVERVLPAVQPMSFDRLTVVLTGAP